MTIKILGKDGKGMALTFTSLSLKERLNIALLVIKGKDFEIKLTGLMRTFSQTSFRGEG